MPSLLQQWSPNRRHRTLAISGGNGQPPAEQAGERSIEAARRGYPSSQNTWEPAAHLNARVISEFNEARMGLDEETERMTTAVQVRRARARVSSPPPPGHQPRRDAQSQPPRRSRSERLPWGSVRLAQRRLLLTAAMRRQPSLRPSKERPSPRPRAKPGQRARGSEPRCAISRVQQDRAYWHCATSTA